jgi:hypothetical protein
LLAQRLLVFQPVVLAIEKVTCATRLLETLYETAAGGVPVLFVERVVDKLSAMRTPNRPTLIVDGEERAEHEGSDKPATHGVTSVGSKRNSEAIPCE